MNNSVHADINESKFHDDDDDGDDDDDDDDLKYTDLKTYRAK
jgi:hypothetical protein